VVGEPVAYLNLHRQQRHCSLLLCRPYLTLPLRWPLALSFHSIT